MRLIVDAQLPPALADWLRSKGHDAVAVRDIGLKEADDRTIWAKAKAERAVIVTKDEDFTLLAPTTNDAPQVLWVRTGNLVNRLLLNRFERSWPEIEAHLLNLVKVVEVR